MCRFVILIQIHTTFDACALDNLTIPAGVKVSFQAPQVDGAQADETTAVTYVIMKKLSKILSSVARQRNVLSMKVRF